MSNGEVTQCHSASVFGYSRRAEDQNPEQQKITRRKYQPRILVNETSTSTMLEEQLNINANSL